MVDERESENEGFTPFETKKRVREKDYTTNADPRGHIPVYEFRIGNTGTNKVLVDRETSFVYITGILKALGKVKAEITRLIENQPEIDSVLRKIRGGASAVQGTWLPYEYAKMVSQRIAWPIRDELIPVFGPDFPYSCLRPGAPGFGRFTLSEPHRGFRKSESRPQAKSAALAAQNSSKVPTIVKAQASSSYTSRIARSEDYNSQRTRKSPFSSPPSTEDTALALKEELKRDSQAGPYRHRWKGYDAPIQPPQDRHLSTTATYSYSTFDPQSSRLSHSSSPRSLNTYASASPTPYLPRTLPEVQPVFISQGYSHLPVPPNIPHSYNTTSNPYHHRRQLESYPFYKQARRGIRLPPRASFSAYSPTSPLHVASLRSTLDKGLIAEQERLKESLGERT
ncbi:hypothetical protein JCM5350_006544 [Sporobolomyces pararoseus]